MEQQTVKEEIKVEVGRRVKPGDRWNPVDNKDIIFDSLTDLLEYVYQKSGHTQFFMDAKKGITYVIETEDKIIPPPLVKRYSLYDEQ
jgi:hypothetical protein